ncbi:MAG: glutaredoxin family protein [Methanolobus sp.]|uniref:glutaredoxin family protein n=1 Tax=Methanolobus sp. TaxID=1874737 RepID=UPI002730D312|nr:glutaredoxin family protein [Methanolobus sp.]MDP2217369.1 glutaredoxin family protein [Methanolobus sp.]
MDTKKIMDKSRKMFQRVVEPLGHNSSLDEKTENISNDEASGFESETHTKKVTIYALTTCPWCKKARKFFMEKNAQVEYIEYDKADEETRKSIKEECSSYMEELAFPVIKSGGNVVVGYDTKKYASLLEQ